MGILAAAAVISRIKSYYPSQLSSSLVRWFSSRAVTPSSEKIGFIGLGNMGSHMASNLIKAGYQLTVHDINASAMKRFSDKGVPTKATPAEVADSSDIVITMLPSSTNVIDVYTGPNGLLQGKEIKPWLFVDSSTIDPQSTRSISSNMSEYTLKENKGLLSTPTMLDAPVSGGVLGAEAATLTFMVGGLEEAYMIAKPLFLSMGKRAIYCGGSGNGAECLGGDGIAKDESRPDSITFLFKNAAKICNNLAMAVSMIGISEAYALGQRLGITGRTLTNIFNSSSARCWSSDSYNPVPGVMEGVPSARNYEGGFSSMLMAKDLSLAAASMDEVQLHCPLTSKVQEIYIELCKSGHELKDFSCAFRLIYGGKSEN